MRIGNVSIILTLCLLASNLTAQLASTKPPAQPLPAVFFIGEHEAAFESLSFNYQTSLLDVCDENMDVAFEKWLGLLKEMEAFAEVNGMDIRGVKMWINIFWNEEGKIDYLAYHLKPQSKNVDTRYLTALFKEFISVYETAVKHPEKFSHYGIASFPVFSRQEPNKAGQR